VDWTHPDGGLFLWARLPEGMSTHRLLETALKQNVAFVPGDTFFAPGTVADPAEPLRYMRLNFSNASPEMIREGIRRLAVAIREQMGVAEPAPA
jgi:2-aminoadipate transaminase